MTESQYVVTQIIIYIVRYETGIKQFIDFYRCFWLYDMIYDTESNMSVAWIPIK